MGEFLVSVCHEYAIACVFERKGGKGSWTLTFWFERWIGTGTYWLCGPFYFEGAFHIG